MATYKVLQDIEAEDKLIGPLSLRQFIYAGACALNLYLCFLVVTKGVPFMLVVFLPIALVAGFFAWPWAGEQPTEIWALAKIRFFVKPRKRIWNQTGIKELVTITVPKKIEPIRTNGLNQDEVHSRLKALADTIDSRGWAIKNVNVNLYGQAPQIGAGNINSDRLVNPSSFPQEVSTMDIRPSDDILDAVNNPVAQQFDTMIAASEKAHHQRIVNEMNAPTIPQPQAPPIPAPQPMQPQPVQQPQAPQQYWFLNQPSQPTASTVPQDVVTFNTQVVAPGTAASDLPVSAATPTDEEERLIKQLSSQQDLQRNSYSHLHTIQPLSAQTAPKAPQLFKQQLPQMPGQPVPQTPQMPPQQKVTQQPNAAILDLVTNNDLNVATIAREAQKRNEAPQDEVVISLR